VKNIFLADSWSLKGYFKNYHVDFSQELTHSGHIFFGGQRDRFAYPTAGADDYIEKPLKINELLGVITKYTGS
jgi:hypothetical protein